MKRICVLLNGCVRNDGRVIKSIHTMSEMSTVDLFYVDGDPTDQALFPENVNLYYIAYQVTFWQKILRHTQFYKEFDFYVNQVLDTDNDYDIIYCNDLPTLNAGSILAEKLNAKLVYDSHEIFTETVNQFFPENAKGLKKWIFRAMINYMRKHGKKKEEELVKKVDHFITVNESLARYFETAYGYSGVEIMMNCPNSNLSNQGSQIDYREKFNWGNNAVILYYHGVLNPGRGLSLMIDAIAEMDEKYKLVIIGYGPLKTKLMNQVNTHHLVDRVKFYGSVANQEILRYAASADVGLILLDSLNKSKAWASPNKLFEYIHAGIPCICTDTEESRKVIDKFKVGLLVSNNSKDIAQALTKVGNLKNNPLFSRSIEEAKAHYNWETQSKVLMNVLED